MKVFFIILGLLVLAILQTSFVSLVFNRVSPNLVLVLILAWVVIKGFRKIWPMVILAGLFLDLFSGLAFGLISLSLMFTVYLIDLFNRKVFSEVKFWLILFLIALASLFYNLILVVLSRLFVLVGLSQVTLWPDIFSLNYLITLLLAMTYNLAVFIFFYGVKKMVYQKQNW